MKRTEPSAIRPLNPPVCDEPKRPLSAHPLVTLGPQSGRRSRSARRYVAAPHPAVYLSLPSAWKPPTRFMGSRLSPTISVFEVPSKISFSPIGLRRLVPSTDTPGGATFVPLLNVLTSTPLSPLLLAML